MHYFWKGGITILDKNTRNVHNHYSLRKLSVGLVSVLIGLNLVEANNTHKVKADTLADNSDQETNGETPNQSQSFAIVGQIIPVDHKQQEIKNAPRPYYQRDPNDPSKAIATPAPKVDGYHVRKNNQASNYDHETNLVTPPADPSQNTYLVYAKKTVKKSVKDQKKSKDNTDRTSNIVSSKNKEIKNTPQIQNNKKTGGKTSYSSIRENNNDEQVRESVRKTGLFGFGKKKQTDSGTSADEKQTTEPSQTVAAQAQGAQVETTQPSESNNEVEKKSAEAKSNKITEKSSKNKDANNAFSHLENDDERTPEEELADSYDRIKQNVQSQILTTILSKKPQEFERLVVKLLQAMGYGGEVKNSGIVTKLSNDGGIDGIIKEDILGFNHISIQAKRYALDNNVQRHEVQSFVGAVAGTPSKKGVFITTSDYTKGAMEYVESLNGSPTIILINGQQLTEYIYDYGLGLQTEKVLKVMKMDMDYWDAMDNA